MGKTLKLVEIVKQGHRYLTNERENISVDVRRDSKGRFSDVGDGYIVHKRKRKGKKTNA